jgi:ElaB/YqjD/DUF883 family membrane-anchored ribosome-binding protein
MSESDSCIPQKVAALADALDAVCRHIGFGSELDLSFYSCLPPTDSAAIGRDGTLEDARKEVLAAAAKFVEAVDTAERLLNAIPVSALKPLSPYTGGVRWDVATRRTLKEIDEIIFDLRKTSTDLDSLFSKRGVFGKDRFEGMQSKLKRFLDELPKRIFELKCLPSQTYASRSEFAAVRVQLPPAGKGEDGETRSLNGNSLKRLQDEKDLLGKKVATPQTPYQTLWDYAQKMWTSGTDKFKICEHISNGPGNYSECLEHLVPNTSRTDQTKRFHSVCGAMNKEIRAPLGLEVYRFGEQIFVCKAGRKPLEHKPKPQKTTTKKSTTKRKR